MTKLLASLLLACTAVSAFAQGDAYPSRPIKIIVPFGSGSGSDAMARYYAEKMGVILRQSVIVENRPGADGAIGMAAAKSAPADGYTLVQGGISPAAVNVATNPALPYDPVKEFKVIQSYGRNMAVLVTSAASPVKSFADMQAQAKASSAPLAVGTFSTTYSLSSAWLASEAGMEFTHIPYKGQGQVLTDVIGGQVGYAFADISGAALLIKQGKLRALLVSGEQRSPDLPDVPTAQELGLKNFVLYSWNALMVRDEVPEPIRLKLADAMKKVNESPETINNFFKPRGSDVRAISPEAMRAMQMQTIAEFRKVAGTVGLERR